MTLVSFTPNTTIVSSDMNANFTGVTNWSLMLGSSTLLTNSVVTGGIVAISSGLVGTFSNVTYFISGQYYTASSIANKTYTASKDTYVDINTSGTVTYTEVANGAASPALTAGNVRIAKVITNGSAITSVTQSQNSDSLGNIFRNTGIISAIQFVVPYKFKYYRNAAANTGNGAFAVIAHDTKVFDSGNNVSSGVFTVPSGGAGWYQFAAGMSVGSDSVDTAIGLFKNGTEETRGTQGTYGAVSASYLVTSLIQLAATDTVDVRAFAASTKALNVGVASQNFFSGYLVSTN